MFELIEKRHIDSLEVNAKHYQHKKFGSAHLHFESKNNEKVFMVAFRTEIGRAHV